MEQGYPNETCSISMTQATCNFASPNGSITSLLARHGSPHGRLPLTSD